MPSVPFVKIQGAGNDFIFVDLRETEFSRLSSLPRAEFVLKVCNRNFGIGSDGLVFVERSDSGNADLQWDFYNTDGSYAEMCGNAARCMGRWAQKFAGLAKVKFSTRAGIVRAEVDGEGIAAYLDFVRIDLKDIFYEQDGHKARAVLVDTGVPHAVVEVEDIKNPKRFGSVIQALRFHPEVGERGANVTFLQKRPTLQTVTFERGVEDFTLACGTGVLAAAAVALRGPGQLQSRLQAQLDTPGGRLFVELGAGRGAKLSGDAIIVFSGVIDAEQIILPKGNSK